MKTRGVPRWMPEYGYRMSDGWRQKILYGDEWRYPARTVTVPHSVRIAVHARRLGRVLFILRAFGLRPTKWSGHAPALIEVEIPCSLTPDKLRRFVDHCYRSGLAEMRLGLPGVRLERMSRRRR